MARRCWEEMKEGRKKGKVYQSGKREERDTLWKEELGKNRGGEDRFGGYLIKKNCKEKKDEKG